MNNITKIEGAYRELVGDEKVFKSNVEYILRHQVIHDEFIDKCCSLFASPGLGFLGRVTRKTVRKHEKVLGHYKEILKHSLALQKLGDEDVPIDLKALAYQIRLVEDAILRRDVLKTGGKTSNLGFGDVMKLYYLRKYFIEFYPDLSGQYVKNNVLYQLGNEVIGKSPPNKIGKLLEKYETFSKQK